MSYKKVVALAEKFARKTVMLGANQEALLKKEKEYHFFENFQKQFRALLNEMEGDYMSLKIKDLDRPTLQEFGKLYKDLLNIYKDLDPQNPYKGTNRLIDYVHNKSTRSSIGELDTNIQKFLKENQVDFDSGSKMQQARVNSIALLNKLAMYAKSFMIEQMPNVADAY